MKRMPITKPLVALVLGLLLGGTTTTAEAAPAPAGFRMPARTFEGLRTDVTKARARDPQAFVAVNGIVSHAATADAHARGRKAPNALYLAKLGPSALLPMLEMLALDPPRGVPATSAPQVRRDLIEAVGLLRDSRAIPIVASILDDATEDTSTTRTATEALARIGTEDAATRILTALDGSTGDRAQAILGGMGECRRVRIAEALASRLRSTSDEAVARVAARSIGRTGNAWAWKTSSDRTDEPRIRELAARALLDAFVRHEGEARDAASNALMVVDAPETPALIVEAKKAAPPSIARALGELAARFARNPTRTN
jgi:hypothetical protein